MSESAMVVFVCPGCNQQLQVPSSTVGRQVMCPQCAKPVTVPLAAEPAPSIPSAPPIPTGTLQCLYCGQANAENNFKCTACGEPLHEPAPAPAQNTAGLGLILPVNISGWAIAAGYLGLISVLLVPAPFAVVTGILAIRDIRAHSGKHGMARAIFGIIAGSLGTLLLLLMILGLVIAGFRTR
jgi:DNA-directed RNA polymerase subunit RPC12/RpoP